MKNFKRVTLRTLLVMVAVLALPLAYVANQSRLERIALKHISDANGRVFYRRRDMEHDETPLAGKQGAIYDTVPPGQPLIHRFFGTSFLCSGTQVYLGGEVDNDTLHAVCLMPKLDRLDLSDTIVDPAIVERLEAEHPSIEFAGKPRGTPDHGKPTNMRRTRAAD